MNKITITVGTHRTLQDLISYINTVKHLHKADRKHYRISLLGWYYFKGQKTSYKYVLRPLVHDIESIRKQIRIKQNESYA